MESAKRVIKFQSYDLNKSVGIFWVVLGLVNIIGYGLSMYSNSNAEFGPYISNGYGLSMAGSNIMVIVIYFIVYGIMIYHQDFALALSFGIRRKDFYASLIFNNIIVALIFGIIQGGLQVVDKYIVEYLGYKPTVDFGIFNTLTDNLLFIVLTLTLIFITIISITNLLGVLQFRFGYKLWIGFGLILFLGQFFTRPITKFWEVFSKLLTVNKISIILTQFGIMIICYSLGYLLIKRTNIKK